jgi:exodeoxyribonuclease VII small subunit
MTQSQSESLTFERAIDELDAIVRTLENGDLPLETALAQFERGVQLARISQKTLLDAEQRVEILLQNDDHSPLSDYTQNDD